MSVFTRTESVCRSPVKEGDIKGSSTKKTKWILTPQFKLYTSQFLTSWADRMWLFSGGLFLIELTPGSFRLVAFYEAAIALTTILLGSAIGRWVDRESRIIAAQRSLILQNAMICCCTAVLSLAITYKTYFSESLYGWGNFVSQVAVIIMASVGEIGVLGSRLSIEKDWIVVLSRSCAVELSTMNSVMRTIDLSTQMLAPVLVGFVMTAFGIVYGGIVIMGWNMVSVTIEYGLLYYLYKAIPDLQVPKTQKSFETNEKQLANDKDNKGILSKVKDAAMTWKLYFTHRVRNAGLSLALLYMTVIALDNFTRVYLYESGVSNAVLGIMTAIASINGIAGSIIFPFLHKRFGTVKSGLFGFMFEVTCLLFCVTSVFAPGTLFVPSALWHHESNPLNDTLASNSSLAILDLSYSNGSYELGSQFDFGDSAMDSYYPVNLTDQIDILNLRNVSNSISEPVEDKYYASIALLLTGIITSRLGLWVADLAVTQILQERVDESERGGINGVQYSLNQTFGLLRAALLIILPSMQTFGYLVILSFIFVFTATILFGKYTYEDEILLKLNMVLQTEVNGKKNLAIESHSSENGKQNHSIDSNAAEKGKINSSIDSNSEDKDKFYSSYDETTDF